MVKKRKTCHKRKVVHHRRPPNPYRETNQLIGGATRAVIGVAVLGATVNALNQVGK